MRVFEMNRILNLGMPRSLFHLSFWIWKMHLGIFIIKSQPRGRVPALTFAGRGSTLLPTGPSRLIHLSKKSLKRKSVFKHWTLLWLLLYISNRTRIEHERTVPSTCNFIVQYCQIICRKASIERFSVI